MSYSRYSMLQKFVNGIPQHIFKQGDLIQVGPFNSYDECNEGNASPSVTPDNPDMLYRWIVSSTPWCDGTDEYKTEKQQQSADLGKTWVDSGGTRRGEFVRSYSFTCGFVAERWIEVNPSIDFICENGNKFYLQKKEISTDGVNWTDSGDKRKGPLIEANSADCGYPQYRWVEIPLNVDYVCVGDSKYYKEKEQITNDGIVWQDTGNTRKGRVAEVHSTDCGYVPPTTVKRWVTVEGEYICQGVNKYKKEKEQISNDSGQTWTDTGNTRAGSLIEKNSYDCGYVSFRWVDVPGEYVCQGYDKYQKQNEEKTTDGKVWTPTGRTRTGALIEKNSYSCGYVSYRWVTVESEYVCSGTDKYSKEKEQSSTDGSVWQDTGRERAGSLIERNSYSCGYVSYRWVVVTGEYVCQGYNKFAKEKEQSSTDGQTWVDTGNIRAGALIESESYDCGYVSYRWVVVEGEYVCQGYNKFAKEKEQSSTDGQTWQDTGNVRAGSLIESDSSDCKEPPTPVKSDYLTFTPTSSGTFRFSFTKPGLYYSTDKVVWERLYSNTATTIAPGQKIYFKGTMRPPTSSPYGIGTFITLDNFTVSGTPMSLLFGDDFEGQTSLSGKDNAFDRLFRNCRSLTSIDGLMLPATELSRYSYSGMFEGCSGLTSVPSGLLPSTSLSIGCYDGMFEECTGLTSVPSDLLKATTLAENCYRSMFEGCTGLTSIPDGLLPATELAKYCFLRMFEGCTGLTSVPSGLLPSTSLSIGCYSAMFRNCANIISVPSDLLKATTLADNCYRSMFEGCTNITTAPDLPADTLTDGCYDSMLKNCTNLNSIRMLATDVSATDCLLNWVSGVASSGTFYKSAGVTIPTGESGIPSGWTVVEV